MSTDAAPKPSNARIALYLAVTAISAACGLIVEIVAGRIIAPYLGMSLYTWTAVIAVVLAGFSVGNWIGGRIADQPPAKAASTTAWSFAAAALTALAILPLLRVITGPILSLDLPAVPTILLLTTALFFAPSVFVGVPSPVLTKLAVDENPQSLGRLIGVFFAGGAIGSIVGTLAAGYVFISFLGSTATIITVALVYTALALIMAHDAHSRQRNDAQDAPTKLPLGKLAAVFVSAVVLITAATNLQAFSSNCQTESDYYCIRVQDTGATFGMPSRALILDHLSHGVNLRDAPQALVSPYVELQSRLVELHHPPPSARLRAYFIGGGAYTLPRAWLATYPQAQIDVAEIDPAVTQAAMKQLWLPSSSRLHVIHKDARRALNEQRPSAARYDVVIGDAFHDIAVPPHLITREFYARIKNALAPDGLYLMNVIDNPDHPRLVASVVATLSDVFTSVEVWISNEPTNRATYIIRASAKPSPVTGLTSNMQPGLAWQKFAPPQMQSLQAKLDPIVMTDDYAPIDRLIGVE